MSSLFIDSHSHARVRGFAGVDHRGRVDDAHMVIDECDVMHGVGHVEWKRRDQRIADRVACDDIHLHALVLGNRAIGFTIRHRDGD